VLCGIVLGFLVVLKPGNGPLALAGVLILVVTLNVRVLVAVIAAAVPAVAALTIWKRTGVGTVPLLHSGNLPLQGGGNGAAGAGGAGPVTGNGVVKPPPPVHRYLNIDWNHFGENVHALGQVFWSVRLLELLLVAGSMGLVVRSRSKGLLVVSWFLAFALVKGGVDYAGVYDTSLYRFLLPSWPAWVLIVAGVVFCWPSSPARRSRQRDEDRRRAKLLRPPTRRLLIVAAVLLGLGPLALAMAASPIGRETAGQMNFTGAPVPIQDFHLRARRVGKHHVRLSWTHVGTSRAATWYQVFKAKDDGCTYMLAGRSDCRFLMPVIGAARLTTFDDTEASGRVVYRVALAAGARVDLNTSAYLLLSKPVTVVLP
jgi:hypothetical protein